MPTLLNLMGIDGRNIPMMGRDLLNCEEGMAIMKMGILLMIIIYVLLQTVLHTT